MLFPDYNNLGKKQILWCEKDLSQVLSEDVDEVENFGNVRDGFHDKEINLTMCYTLDDCVKCSIEGSGSYSNN